MKFSTFRRLTTLTFVLLVLMYASGFSSQVAYAYHQVKIDDEMLKNTPDRIKRVPGHHAHKEKHVSYTESIGIDPTTLQNKKVAPVYDRNKKKNPVEHFDYHEAVHGDLEESQIVDETGHGHHRRRTLHEGDTEAHREHIVGVAAALDKKAAQDGDSTPLAHEAHRPRDSHYGHATSDVIRQGPLGRKATQKIRQHLISKGLLDPKNPKAKLHMPHDLHLTEDDYYNDEENDDYFYEEVEEAEEAPTTTSAGTGTGDKTNNNEEGSSGSKSLSASVSAGSFRKRKLSKASLSRSVATRHIANAYSRRVIAGQRSRPKHVTKAHRYVGADFHGSAPTAKELSENLVVADLNAHEKANLYDDDDENNNGIRLQNDRDFDPASASSSSSHPAEDEHRAYFSTQRERMKAILREKALFYAIQQPKSAAEYVEPADWESFVCQVCTALTDEYSNGLRGQTASAFPIRLIEQAETNVTDYYTWTPGSRLDLHNEDGSFGGRVHRGTFARTRPDDRWDHKPHTKSETEIRTIVRSLFHHFLVTLYEKEVFFPAIQTMSVSTRPTAVPSIFIKEELCGIRKEVCPTTPSLYAGGKFAHLINSLNEAVNGLEHAHGQVHGYVAKMREERELKREIEMEDEEDRLALLEEAELAKHDGDHSKVKKRFSASLGIGEVDEDGNKVIIEGTDSIGSSRAAKGYKIGHKKDPAARELERDVVDRATRRGVEEAEEAERIERLKARHTASLQQAGGSAEHEL